ncbi:MAG TPA: hypothetical protein VML96_00035 [Egibacteraceae bacterium]|nr:hypothetical protein [Egibacteraceae bacterium]
MRDGRAVDPAEVVLAWEAVEELLAAVPEGPAKQILRLVAAGWPEDEIAARMQMAAADVAVLAARARIRVLTAAAALDRSPDKGAA